MITVHGLILKASHATFPLVDYRTDDPEGKGSMSAVLETTDRHVDSVSLIVDPVTP